MPATGTDSHDLGYPFNPDCQYLCSYLANAEIWEKLCNRLSMSEVENERAPAKAIRAIGIQHFVSEYQKSLAARNALNEQLVKKLVGSKSALRKNKIGDFTPTALGKSVLFHLLISGLPTQLQLTTNEFEKLSDEDGTKGLHNILRNITDPESQFLLIAAFSLSKPRTTSEYKTIFSSDEMTDWAKPSRSTHNATNNAFAKTAPSQRSNNQNSTIATDLRSRDQGASSDPASSTNELQSKSGQESTSSAPVPTLSWDPTKPDATSLETSPPTTKMQSKEKKSQGDDPINSNNYESWTYPKLCHEIEQLQTRLSDLETVRSDIKSLRNDCEEFRSECQAVFQSIGKWSQVSKLISELELRNHTGPKPVDLTVSQEQSRLETEKQVLISLEATCKDYNARIKDLKELGLAESIKKLHLDTSSIEKLQHSLGKHRDAITSRVERVRDFESSYHSLKATIQGAEYGDSDLTKEVDKFCSKQLKKSTLMATVICNRILSRKTPISSDRPLLDIPLPILGALFQSCTDGKQIHDLLIRFLESNTIENTGKSRWLRISQYWSEDFFREHHPSLPPAFLTDIFPHIVAKGINEKSTLLLNLAIKIGENSDQQKVVKLARSLRDAIQKNQLEEIISTLDSSTNKGNSPKEDTSYDDLDFLLSTRSGKLGGFYYELLELLASEFKPLLHAIKTKNRGKARAFIQTTPEELLKAALRSANKKVKKNNRYPSWALSKKIIPAFNLARQWIRLTQRSKSKDPKIQKLCSAIDELNLTKAFTAPDHFIKVWFDDLDWFLHSESPGKHPANCRHLQLSTPHDFSEYRLYLATDLLCELWNPMSLRNIYEWYCSNNDFHSAQLAVNQLSDCADDKFGYDTNLHNKIGEFKSPYQNDPLYLEASKLREQCEDINIAFEFLEESLDDYDSESADVALEQIGLSLDDYRRASSPSLNYSPRFLRESGVKFRSDSTKVERDKLISDLKRNKYKEERSHCSAIEDVIEVYLSEDEGQIRSTALKPCLLHIDLPGAYPTPTDSQRYSKLLEPLLDYLSGEPDSLELAHALSGLLINRFTANDPSKRNKADQLLRELNTSQKRQRLGSQVSICNEWLSGTTVKDSSHTTTETKTRHSKKITPSGNFIETPEIKTKPKPKLEPEIRHHDEDRLNTQVKKADQFREDIQLLDLIPIPAATDHKNAHRNNFKPGDEAWQNTKLLLRKRTIDWNNVHQILLENCQLEAGKPLSESESLSIVAAVKAFSADPEKPLKDKIEANAILLDVLATKPPITFIGQDVYASLLQSSVKISLTAKLNNEVETNISFDRWIEDHHSASFAPGSKLFNLDDDFNRRSKVRPSDEDYSNFPGSILAVLYNSLRSITNHSVQIKTRSRILKHLFGRGDLPSINYLLRDLKDIGKELERVIQSLHAAQSDPAQREAVNTQIHVINHRISKKSISGVRPFLDFLNRVQDELTSTIAADGILIIQEHDVDLGIDDSPYLSVKFWITNDSNDWFNQAIITVEETEASFGEIEPFERSQNTDSTELNSNQAFLLNPESGEKALAPSSRLTAHMKIPVREEHADFYRIPYSITYRSTKGNEKTFSGNVTYTVPAGPVEQPSESWLAKHYEGRTGAPVTKTAFHGRTAIISKLNNVIQKNESALIHGARRVGKTSLIDVLKQEACDPNTGYQMPDLSRSFYLKVIMSRADTDVNAPQPMAGDLIFRIIEAIEGEPGLKARIQEAPGPHRNVIAHWKKSLTREVESGFSVARSILKIYDYLKENGILRRMVFFIDEAQTLRTASDSKRICGFLRDEIMHNRDIPISFIFVGSGALKFVTDNPVHPLYHSVEVAELKGFDMKENEACDETFMPMEIRGEFLADDGGAEDELVLAKARELTGRVPMFLSILGAATAKQWGIRRINQALVEDTAERLAQGEIDIGQGPSIFYAYQESGLANHRPHIHHLAKYLWYMIAEKTTLSKRMLNYKVLQKDPEYRRIYEHPIVNYALFDEAVAALIAENLIEENTTEGVRYLSMKAPLTHLALKKDDVLGPRKVKSWDHLIEALNDLETSTDSEGK